MCHPGILADRGCGDHESWSITLSAKRPEIGVAWMLTILAAQVNRGRVALGAMLIVLPAGVRQRNHMANLGYCGRRPEPLRVNKERMASVANGVFLVHVHHSCPNCG
jgi:hypothetical protein